MAQISVEVNGRPYAVGCEDGQEPHLMELAKLFDHQVRQVSQDMGQLGDTRLFLMGALLLADELSDARARLAQSQAEVSRLQADGKASTRFFDQALADTTPRNYDMEQSEIGRQDR